MPITPKPFEYKCPKCNYTKIVIPKSDVLSTMDFDSTCPKCGATMKVKVTLSKKISSFLEELL